MGKAHETGKAAKKLPMMNPKEKKAAKRAKKHMLESPPNMGLHHG